jgi:hypothetical protein
LYTGDYSLEGFIARNEQRIAHLKVHLIAHTFDIAPLRKLSLVRFRDQFNDKSSQSTAVIRALSKFAAQTEAHDCSVVSEIVDAAVDQWKEYSRKKGFMELMKMSKGLFVRIIHGLKVSRLPIEELLKLDHETLLRLAWESPLKS